MSDEIAKAVGKSAYFAADLTYRDPQFYETIGKAAIAKVLEYLVAETEKESFMDFTGDWERSSSEGFADWLRSKLEVTTP